MESVTNITVHSDGDHFCNSAMLLIWMVLGSVLEALRAKYNHWTSQSLVHKCISLTTSGYAAHYCCVRYMWDGCVKMTSKAFWGLNIAPESFLCRHRWSIVADGHPIPFKYRYAFRKREQNWPAATSLRRVNQIKQQLQEALVSAQLRGHYDSEMP